MEPYVILGCVLSLLCTYRCDAGPVDMFDSNANCTDFKQQPVASGERFIPPGFDTCTSCVCMNGREEMCLAMLCQFPCPNYVTVEDKCCEFICFDGPNVGGGNGGGHQVPTFNVTLETTGNDDFGQLNPTNIGLRLVASTVTSFLILALLLFMIHRLRQRRLLLMIRRLNGGQLSGSYGARRFSYDEDGSVGYLTGQDQVDMSLYEDPPPPYTFWKPPETYFPQEEAPPPYEPFSTFNPNNSNQRQQQMGIIQPVPSNVVTAIQNDSQRTHPIYPINYCASLTFDNNPVNETNSFNFFQGSCRANNFQLNNLDQESQDRRPRHSVPIQNLNVIGSLSSLTSSQSDLNESQSVTRTSDSTDVVIRSDATYEDLHPVSMMLPPAAIEAVQRRDSASVRNVVKYRDQRALKCHSCSDMVVDNWPSSASRSDKRRSLQPGAKVCTDPTKWNVDASESSSSSSPTFDRTTLSPTSSDSSSICGFHFESEVVATETNKRASVSGACSISAPPSHVRANCGDNLENSEKITKKGPSKLRQILGSFNSTSTLPKKASFREKKDVGHKPLYVSKYQVANHPATIMLGLTLNKSLLFKEKTPEHKPVVWKKPKYRPRSYDFGDLYSARTASIIGEEASLINNREKRSADEVMDGVRRKYGYRTRSLDNFSFICSSGTSLGDQMLTRNSSAFHSQEGFSISSDLHRCSSMVAEPPSSPENGEDVKEFDTKNKWTVRHNQDHTRLGKSNESINKYNKSSRVNEGRRRQSCNKRENGLSGEATGENTASTSQHFANVPNNTRLRLTLDTSKGSHESYI